MKITDVQTILLTGPSTNDPYFLEARQLRSAALIEIHTDGPHTGVGESYAGYFCPQVVPAIADFYRPILFGAEPSDVHTLTRLMAQCGAYCGRGLGLVLRCWRGSRRRYAFLGRGRSPDAEPARRFRRAEYGHSGNAARAWPAAHRSLGEAFVMRDGNILPPEQPGLGVRLTDEIKAKYPFVPGSGEFNSVPGKILTS